MTLILIMQEQEKMTSTTATRYPAGLSDAYGLDADAVAMAKKRSAADAELSTPTTKKNVVSVQIVDDTQTPQETAVAVAKTTQMQPLEESIPDTKFEWRFLSSADHLRAVLKIADTLSANGDYLNVNPDSEAYSNRFGQRVDCGWNFQFQTPPMVSTTGLHESPKYEGQWGALLAPSDNMNLCNRLKIRPEVTTCVAFLRELQKYLNNYIVANGEKIFLNTAKRQDEDEKEKGKPNKYRDVAFVTRGRNDPVIGELWRIGSYTEERYAKEMQPLIGSWFATYEGNEPSIQVRAYPKKVGNVRDNHTPDIVIVNADGEVETFNPKAPYCVGGATSWECLLKVSVKWYQNQFRMYLNMRSIIYHVHGNQSGAESAQNAIIFTDANGNKRRVTQH